MMTTFATHTSILTIPQELTEEVLKHCEPRDIARLAATCKPLWNIIYNENDQVIWRVSFLSLFDDPRKALPNTLSVTTEMDWKRQLQQRIRAENVLADGRRTRLSDVTIEDSMPLEDPSEDRPIRDALRTLISAVASAVIGSEGISDNLSWVESVFLCSPLFTALSDLPSWPDRSIYGNAVQLIAQLQCYLALSHEDGKSKESERRLSHLRSTSRCYVYDLRKYKSETLWGPFLLDARRRLRVNWEHVRHIQNIVLMNLRDFPDVWNKLWPEWGIEATRPYSAPAVDMRKPWDWAGVEGKWRRVVCFMDYRFVSRIYVLLIIPNASHPEISSVSMTLRLIALSTDPCLCYKLST
jgi:hypothetical protein